MSIRRGPVPAVDHFTIVPNDWARDERLSWAARGLLAYLLSHREGWEVSGVRDLARRSATGREATDTAVRELERYGYLLREQTHGPAGRFTGVDYTLTGSPLPAGEEAPPAAPRPAGGRRDRPAREEAPEAGNPGTGTGARDTGAREPGARLSGHKEEQPKNPPNPPRAGGTCSRHPQGPPPGTACRGCGTDRASQKRARAAAAAAAASAAAAARAAARVPLSRQRDPNAASAGADAVRAALRP